METKPRVWNELRQDWRPHCFRQNLQRMISYTFHRVITKDICCLTSKTVMNRRLRYDSWCAKTETAEKMVGGFCFRLSFRAFFVKWQIDLFSLDFLYHFSLFYSLSCLYCPHLCFPHPLPAGILSLLALRVYSWLTMSWNRQTGTIYRLSIFFFFKAKTLCRERVKESNQYVSCGKSPHPQSHIRLTRKICR